MSDKGQKVMDSKILYAVSLDPKLNSRTGKTRHVVNGVMLTQMPQKLVILQFDGALDYYLIHLDESGEELTDTNHDSIESAMDQAKFEFLVEREQWKHCL